jgi:hypothetical protein
MEMPDVCLPDLPCVKPSPYPWITQSPAALLSGCGPYTLSDLPEKWIPAQLHYAARRRRSSQVRGYYLACRRIVAGSDEVPEFSQLDPVAAGVLLTTFHPLVGSSLRDKLISCACSHPFGAYLTAHSLMTEGEQAAAFTQLAGESRLLYWLHHRGVVSCEPFCANRNDLWSGLTMLPTAQGEGWLKTLAVRACDDPVAASAALALQPGADRMVKEVWLDRVASVGSGRWAYETARWTRHTWLQPEWVELRDRLRSPATADKAKWHYHWYSHVAPELAKTALADPDLDTLWRVELVAGNADHWCTEDDMRLRYILGENLTLDAETRAEAVLALSWLNSRTRPQ